MSRLTFVVSLSFIVAVSAYDNYQCVVDREHFPDIELNPIARQLVVWDGGVGLLVSIKTAGIGVSSACLVHLRRVWPEAAQSVTAALVVVQSVTLMSLI